MFWLLWSLVETLVRRRRQGRGHAHRFLAHAPRHRGRDEARREGRARAAAADTRDAAHGVQCGGIDNNVAQLSPIVDARGAMSRMTMTAGSDRDVIPLVRINPDYPPRALSAASKAGCRCSSRSRRPGTVKDPIVVERRAEEHLRRRGAEGDRALALQPEGRGRRRRRARRRANRSFASNSSSKQEQSR